MARRTRPQASPLKPAAKPATGPQTRSAAATPGHMPLDVEISGRLIREIIELQHPPGTWLREQEIAERFKVSRSPVREALRHVAKAGFVEMHPWRGAQVVELSEETTRQILDMLEALYGVIARCAARTMPPERIETLAAMFEKGVYVGEPRHTREERVAFSFEIGRFIGRWGAEPKTREVFNHIASLARWQHRFMQTEDVFAQRSVEAHRVLLSAIRARDEARAEWAARTIVDLSRDRILPHLPHPGTTGSEATAAGNT